MLFNFFNQFNYIMKKLFLFSVLLIVNFSFSQKNEMDILIKKGITFYEKQELDDAIVYFEKAKTQDALNDKTYRYLGLCYDKKFDNIKAIENYEKAIELNNGNSDMLINLGMKYRFLNKLDKTFECYKKYIDFKPESEQGYICTAIIYSKLENYKESNNYAIIALQKAKIMNPDLVLDIKSTIAYNYYFLNEKVLAKELFEELIKNKYEIYNEDILIDLSLKQ